MLLLEVSLISVGVFLGMLGEQWRETRAHHELAETTLRNFQAEITANRAALVTVRTYHQGLGPHLAAFMRTDGPKTAGALSRLFTENQWEWRSLAPLTLQHTAWDLALATQSLEYIDPQAAIALSRVYTAQTHYADLQNGARGAVYTTVGTSENFGGFLQIVNAYLGDTSLAEPALLSAYDQALPQIAHALAK